MTAAVITGMGTLVGFAAAQIVVSQKGREFHPGSLTLKRDDMITIVNDDADLRHHAYIDLDNFQFDSGDQEPGNKADITFPVVGTFDVLCAIHPKMKLTVHVHQLPLRSGERRAEQQGVRLIISAHKRSERRSIGDWDQPLVTRHRYRRTIIGDNRE